MNREEWILKAIDAGACEGFIEFVEEHSNFEFEDLPEEWKLWAVGKIKYPFVSEQIERWGDECPHSAFEYCSNLISPEQIEKWGTEKPYAALQFCSHKLTPEQLDKWGNEIE